MAIKEVLIVGILSNLFNFIGSKYCFESDKLYKAFGVKPAMTELDKEVVKEWADIYFGNAYWLVESGRSYNEFFGTESNGELRTLDVAKTVCEELSRLITLDIDIQVTGSEHAKYLQDIVNVLKENMREDIDLGCGLGYLIFKPYHNGVDVLNPFNVIPIRWYKKELLEAIFIDKIEKDKNVYVRAEYHNYINEDDYVIKNKDAIKMN